jgi:hypothetical protein
MRRLAAFAWRNPLVLWTGACAIGFAALASGMKPFMALAGALLAVVGLLLVLDIGNLAIRLAATEVGGMRVLGNGRNVSLARGLGAVAAIVGSVLLIGSLATLA